MGHLATADCTQSDEQRSSGGMHRRSNTAGTFATGCKPRGPATRAARRRRERTGAETPRGNTPVHAERVCTETRTPPFMHDRTDGTRPAGAGSPTLLLYFAVTMK